MTKEQEILLGLLNNASCYEALSQGLTSAIEILVTENEQINTSPVDQILYDANEKRGIISTDALRIRRSKHVIADHIRRLVFASAEEHIDKHGTFMMPSDGDNDYVFDDEIIQKYEVFDAYASKDDYDKFGYIEIELTGSVLEAFEHHDCTALSVSVYFYGELGLDFIKFDKMSDVTDYFMRIDVKNVENIAVDDLIALADQLHSRKNDLLLVHELKYAEKRRV